MGNIFPNSRCLSLSVAGPHPACQGEGKLVQVWRRPSALLTLLLQGVEAVSQDEPRKNTDVSDEKKKEWVTSST